LTVCNDHVWVWEGPWIDAMLGPSIYGLGEGARYFHAKNIAYLYGQNDAPALEKLRHFKRVICDVSKWRFRCAQAYAENQPLVQYHDSAPGVAREEALNLSRLSRSYGSIVGGVIDDLSSTYLSQRRFSPKQLEEVSSALKEYNPSLNLYAVVYTKDLDLDFTEYAPHIDVVNLWVWENIRDLKNLDAHIEKCLEVFPRKPVLLGLYMRNYPSRQAMPLELLEFEFKKASQYIDEGKIIGFIVFAAFLIDKHPEQAEWVRRFLENNFLEA